jgi:O-acetyl-ADP-ribose deacetylase (regulator of RNase III)
MVGHVRLLSSHGRLASLKNGITTAIGGRSIDVKLDKDNRVITGLKDDVQEALQHYRSEFFSKVCYDKVEVPEADLKPNVFASPNKSDLIDELEKKHKCVIEVRTKGSRTLADILNGKSSASRTTNSAITVVEGNLVEFQADVLVNAIGANSTDLSKCGPLSKAFLAAGGKELGQAFAALDTPVKFGADIGVTDATGVLLAKKIYHAAMRRYRNPQSIQFLRSLICECLRMAQAHNMSSIAFPTLGCGNYGYEIKHVVECFMQAADSVGGLEIYIVAFDHSVFEVFKDKFSKPSGSTTVIFHISAMSDDDVCKAREQLRSLAMNLFVSLPIDHDVIEHLTPAAEAEIMKLQTPDIRINIDKSAKRIKISTPSQQVESTRKSISKILRMEEQRINDPRYIKKTNGVAAYLRALAAQDIEYPSHWTTHKGRDVSPQSGIWGETKGVTVELQPSSPVYTEIKRLVTETWENNKVGFGNDAAGLHHRRIDVRKIFRVENPKLYHKYRLKMKAFCLSAATTPFPPMTVVDKDEVKTRTLHLKELEAALVPEINEYFLLHGTKVNTRDTIVKQGLDSRLSNSTFFGNGIYFADSSTKSDQYADSIQQRTAIGQPLYMFVCRVTLGNPYVARKPKAFRRPPCTHVGCNSDTCTTHHDMYDSVLGTHKRDGTPLLFREFIVYHPDQSYPEYLVEYVRQ